jgi:hypothetical protein
MQQTTVEQEMRIVFQLLETQIAAIHQKRLFNATMRSIQYIRDDVKVTSMIVTNIIPAYYQFDCP